MQACFKFVECSWSFQIGLVGQLGNNFRKMLDVVPVNPIVLTQEAVMWCCEGHKL